MIGTTAGWKSTFAYEKLLQVLVQQIIEPEEAIVLGGTWRIPVMEKLLQKSFIEELKMDDTYSDATFAREYESVWGGDSANAFFSADKIDRNRTLIDAEFEYNKKLSKNSFYVLGVDVGRLNCTTEVLIFKVTPQPQGSHLKKVVNIFSYEAEDFEKQAIYIKRLYYAFHARRVAIDANGLGIALIEFMTKTQTDPETGEELPPFGVYDGTMKDAKEQYRQIKGVGVEEDAMYLIKANAEINTTAHSYTQSQILSGKVKFLVDERMAKSRLLATRAGQNMSPERRVDYLKPFVLTSTLREELLNLVEENEGVNIILKPSSSGTKKDKFSALEYGLYYIRLEEERDKKRRGRRNIKDFMFFTPR